MLDHWPLTGRAEEFGVIAELLVSEEYRGIALAGRPGVGKSRLAREAVLGAAESGWTVRHVAATATGRSVPLGAFAQWTDDFDGAPLALARRVIGALTDGADPTIIVRAASSPTRYFSGLFLLFWLGMWTFGFRDAASKVLSGNANGFLIFWLCGWTVGGILAVFTLYRIVRSPIPESLQLGRNSLIYDSGIPPFQFNSTWRYRSPKDQWKAAFPKRVRIDLDRNDETLVEINRREFRTCHRVLPRLHHLPHR